MRPLAERHVQAVWYDRELRPEALATRRGAPVRVVHPGIWNLGAGPDFKDAVLEVGVGRTRLRGDVEVHLTPSEWDAHAHGADPAYRNVVAHVTWGCGPVPATLPPGAVSIWLGRFMTARPEFSPEQIDLSAYPFARMPAADRPCHERLKDDPDSALRLLSESGRRRLSAKAGRLRRLFAGASGPRRRQLFYEEVMGALGYGWNSQSFRALARAVPLAALVAEPEYAAGALLAAAGFFEWRRGGLRPRNIPEARLCAAAAIFTGTGMLALADADDFSRRGCRGMVAEMTRGHVLGRGRAAAILANVVVPLAFAERRIGAIPDWLPPEDVSEPVRLAAARLFGRDHNPAVCYAGNGLHIQGLIQIYRDCCLRSHPECQDCELAGADSEGWRS